MLALIFGIILVVSMGSFFVYSLPRGGKLVWYAGSEWEGYIVVIMIGILGVGLMVALQGVLDMLY